MNNGRVDSFARPYDMIMDEGSLLNEMLNSLDKFERERLIELARQAANSPMFVSASPKTNRPNTNSSLPFASEIDSADDIEGQNLLPK